MSGDVVRWWSMWSYTMASGGENAADRSMKAKSREVVDVVVFAIEGDARDVSIKLVKFSFHTSSSYIYHPDP